MTAFAGTVDGLVFDMLTAFCPKENVYMFALYVNSPALTAGLERYTPRGEVQAKGYVTGGIELSGYRLERKGAGACLTFDAPMWKNMTVKGVDAGLLYNRSKDAKAIQVYRFKDVMHATNGPFSVTSPIVVEIGVSR